MNFGMFLLAIGCCFFRSLFGDIAIEDSVVKIYQARNTYDYGSPWSSPSQGKLWGTGFIISGNRILTNAHIVSNAVFVQVKRPGGIEKYQAEVAWIGHDCDLALLTIPDQAFFQGTVPIPIASLIAPEQTKVTVLGYPIGGEDLSITKGIISRTEVQQYSHSRYALLCSQIDAPINPGNSRGPVISNGQVVGVVHQGIHGSQNLGYMIPIPIIKHFLQEIDEGKYKGFPKGGIRFQTMENPALRTFYQMDKGSHGVLVTDVLKDSFFNEILLPGDVLLTIDGIPIAIDGTFDFEYRKRVSFSHLFSRKHYEEFIDLEILRDGNKITLSVLMENRYKQSLLGEIEHDKCPTYFVVGGLVFQPLTFNYLAYTFEDNSPPIRLLYYLQHGKLSEDRSEVIVLTRVLPDFVNVGYQTLIDEVVVAVNGVKIRNMQDMIHAFEMCKEPFYRISLESDTEIVIDRREAQIRHDEIMQNYLIFQDRSENLRK